jgi:hypothetical protein
MSKICDNACYSLNNNLHGADLALKSRANFFITGCRRHLIRNA